MAIDNDLYYICKDFVNDNQIKDESDIEQLDPDLLIRMLERVCDIIGYYEEEDISDWEDSDEGC